MTEGEETIPELRGKITEYRQQLVEVDSMLQAEPKNDEYLQIKKDLLDVISLTEDLLKIKQHEAAYPAKALPFTPPSTTPNSHATFFDVGTICEGRFGEDQQWYKAKINSILDGGKYHVTYTEYGNEEVLSITDIRPLPDATKKSGILPLKRPAIPEAIQQIPKSLQFLPTDTDEQKAAKKKKVKSIKSSNRLIKLDEENTVKKGAWESFQNKPKRAVPMSYSNKKKESIFKSPEVGGRIGVTGSGNPMTQDTTKNMPKFVPKKADIYLPSNKTADD